MDLFEEIVRMRKAGQRAALATIVHTNGSIPSYESSRMLVREDGSISGTIGGGCVEAEVWAAAKEVIQAEQPRKMTFNLNHDAAYDAGLICGGTLEIFVEPILPPARSLSFRRWPYFDGCGRVAAPAGFLIGIIDDREAFANKERFPMANELYTTYEEAFEKLQPNSSSYVVIVTRGHKDDMRVLAWAVNTNARYIGMIGSKRKVISVYKALEKEGYSPEKFDRVYAPVGLEIGALTPEEIAVSITAELIAVRRNAAQGLQHKSVKLFEAAALAIRTDCPTNARRRNSLRGRIPTDGIPKALLPYRGYTFLEHLIEVTTHPRIGMRKDCAWRGRGKIFARSSVSIPSHCRYQRNIIGRQGQLSSIQAAVRSLPARRNRRD